MSTRSPRGLLRPSRPATRFAAAFLRDERGVTLIEMIVVVALVGLILAPILAMSTLGARTEAVARRQLGRQGDAHQVLREIVDGAKKGGITVPGLRGADEVKVNGGLSFLAGITVVTYYLSGDGLYRKTCDTADPGCAVEDPVDPSGGTEILTAVQEFAAVQDQNDPRLITVRLEVETPASRATGDSDTGIRLVTRVVVRNLQ